MVASPRNASISVAPRAPAMAAAPTRASIGVPLPPRAVSLRSGTAVARARSRRTPSGSPVRSVSIPLRSAAPITLVRKVSRPLSQSPRSLLSNAIRRTAGPEATSRWTSSGVGRSPCSVQGPDRRTTSVSPARRSNPSAREGGRAPGVSTRPERATDAAPLALLLRSVNAALVLFPLDFRRRGLPRLRHRSNCRHAVPCGPIRRSPSEPLRRSPMRFALRPVRIAPLVVGILGCLTPPVLAQVKNPDREAYFGETHVHTSWSLDAFSMGNTLTTPADAYKYFKGEPIKHPLGYEVKIDTPLDWAGVTDHSEYAGVVQLANEPGSAVSKLPAAQPLILKARTQEEMTRVALYAINVLIAGPPVKALMAPEIAGGVWKRNVELAERANVPGKFSALCSYEWTSMPNNMNLHRNIFFKDCAKVPPMPFSALDSVHPVDLWSWMDGQRKAGNDLLAISHNANLSDGRMFPIEVDSKGRPIDAAYAGSRVRNEPLIEIKQLKGTSETHPLLSPNDEFANFELMSVLLGDPPGRIPHIVGSYARQALKDGLAMQDAKGFNPYKFGFGAASDSHNTGVPYRQDNFFGGHSFTDGTIEVRMSGNVVGGFFDARSEGTGGLTGVWAEENTRASLCAAMQRKETFAVSGPHIRIRLFGGWAYTADLLADEDWVKTAYAKGVPMGGDLPPASAKAPTFMVWAVKDPTSGNLDRIQIVKGWAKHGQSFEKIFDVVWAGDRKPD